MQLDLFAPSSTPPPIRVEPEIDPLTAKLIEAGLVSNRYFVTFTEKAMIPCHPLPSRLFQFPLDFIEGADREDGESVLLLNHPDLASFPFVDRIEEATSVRPHWEPLDEFGRDRGFRPRYFHAVDLLDDEHWRGLIETINFTDRDAIICALKYRADYGGLSLPHMRAVLVHIGAMEPEDRSEAFLRSDAVRVANCQQGKFVGIWTKDEQSVWAAIHGLENKKFKRDRNGHLRFSPAFLEEKERAAA